MNTDRAPVRSVERPALGGNPGLPRSLPGGSRSIAGDDRGAILLLGIVMGSVAVGALWYLVGVANAILVQERLQDAADATAFQSAVLHARGMNLLALMNMLMAIILTIMVAIRLVEIVVLVVAVICHIAAAPTGVGEVGCAGFDAATMGELLVMDYRVGKYVTLALTGITLAEAGVAYAVPYLATGRGLGQVTDFYRSQGVSSTNAYSLSLLPTSVDLGLKALGSPVKPRVSWLFGAGASAYAAGAEAFGSSGAFVKSLGSGWASLPVESDDFAQLCSRTGEFIASSQPVHGIIDVVGPRVLPSRIAQALEDTDQIMLMGVGDVFGSASVVLCEPLMSIVTRLVMSVTHLPKFVSKRVAGGIVSKVYGKLVSNAVKAPGFSGTNISHVHPAALWSIAHNGNPFTRTWASAGRPAQSRWAFARNIAPRPGQAVAAAEYYASCYEVGQSIPDHGMAGALKGALMRDCEDDALWRIGWSARMRRVRPIVEELRAEQIAADLLEEALSDQLPPALAKATPAGNFLDWLFDPSVSPVGGLVNDMLGPTTAPQPEPRSNIIH